MGIWCNGLDPKAPDGKKFTLSREDMEFARSLIEKPPVGMPDPRSSECWLYSDEECHAWATQLEQAAVSHLAGLAGPRELPDTSRAWLFMDFANFLKSSGGIRHDF